MHKKEDTDQTTQTSSAQADSRDTDSRWLHAGVKRRAKKRGSGLSYTASVMISFALISVMTALVASLVLSFVWEQHFQTYTRKNMESIAETTASNLASRYASEGNRWHSGALDLASMVNDLNSDVGVQVVDSDGTIIYDDSRALDAREGMSLAPTQRDSLAVAPIVLEDGTVVGEVRVWAFGSSGLLTEADQLFRTRSYEAIVFSTLLAVFISLLIGLAFARSLVDPIKRISHAAKAIGEGDLSARTNLEGDDEISRLGMTFDDMAESVEADRQLERRLTSDVAHELRTPLMAIQATVEAILDGVFEADEERLETIDSEVQRLSRLVDAILKLSRLENRTTPLKEELVNVGDLVSTLVVAHEAFVLDSGLYLHYQADDDVFVYGDRDMIRQAVANLISNAVRYTPEGGITITVKKGDIMAAIAVEDTGIGLSEEEAKMVFSRFWRADAGRTRESGGLGVGLAVVKEIVEQHDGWVRVEGKPNVGCIFTIYIPLYNEEKIKQKRQKQRRRLNKEEETEVKPNNSYAGLAAGHEARRPLEKDEEGYYWD